MFSLQINTDNAAFDPDKRFEVARMLRHLANKIVETGLTGGVLRDTNGNRVGDWKFEET